MSQTASLALLLWYFDTFPENLPENPQPLVPYIDRRPVPGPYDPMFLVNIVGAIERKYGNCPDFDDFSPEWYKHFENLLIKEDEMYEKTCETILKILLMRGEFVTMTIRPDMRLPPHDDSIC